MIGAHTGVAVKDRSDARFERLTIKEFIEFALASATFLTKKGTRAGIAPAAPISRTVGGEQQA